jgi:hypothetical protein
MGESSSENIEKIGACASTQGNVCYIPGLRRRAASVNMRIYSNFVINNIPPRRTLIAVSHHYIDQQTVLFGDKQAAA